MGEVVAEAKVDDLYQVYLSCIRALHNLRYQ